MGDYRDNAKDFTSFVMIKRNRSAHSFREYMDKETGEVVSITSHIDPKTGLPVPRRFKWTANQPVFKVPNKQTKVIEFIRNYPGCYKSKNAGNPNADKSHFIIAEINSAEDARIANNASKLNAKAIAMAYALEEYPDKLARIARMVGEDSNLTEIQLFACANYAKSNAAKFIELMNDESAEVREIVEDAISKGIIKRQGFMYRMGKVHVGSHSVDDVVNKISGDPELLESLNVRISGPAEDPFVDDLPKEFKDLVVEDHESEGKTRTIK